MMQHTLLAAAFAATLLAASPAAAQTLSLSGTPGTMTVASATAGSPPDAVVESTTTYTLAGVPSGSRIVGRLESPLPPGLTLRVTLAAPAGGASAGKVTLSTVNQELVGQIPAGDFSGLAITYELVAPAAAGTVALSSIAVAFEIVSPP